MNVSRNIQYIHCHGRGKTIRQVTNRDIKVKTDENNLLCKRGDIILEDWSENTEKKKKDKTVWVSVVDRLTMSIVEEKW